MPDEVDETDEVDFSEAARMLNLQEDAFRLRLTRYHVGLRKAGEPELRRSGSWMPTQVRGEGNQRVFRRTDILLVAKEDMERQGKGKRRIVNGAGTVGARHHLTEIDEDSKTAICSVDGRVALVQRGASNPRPTREGFPRPSDTWRCPHAVSRAENHFRPARKVAPKVVTDYVHDCGLTGSTAPECESALAKQGYALGGVSAVWCRLLKDGRIKKTGIKRETESGKRAAVCVDPTFYVDPAPSLEGVPEGPKVPSYSETAKGLRDLLAAMLAAVAIGETAQGITLGRELLNSDIAVSLFRDLTMAILKSTTIPEREVENLIKTQRAAFDEWLEATVKDVRRVRDKYTADFSLFNFMTSGRRKAVVAACQRFDARVPQTDFEQIPITDDTEDGKRARHALRRKRAECHADKFINESEEVRNVKAAQYKRVNDDWDLLVEWNDYLDRVSNKEASDDIRRNDDSGGNAGNQGQDPSQGQEHHVG